MAIIQRADSRRVSLLFDVYGITGVPVIVIPVINVSALIKCDQRITNVTYSE